MNQIPTVHNKQQTMHRCSGSIVVLMAGRTVTQGRHLLHSSHISLSASGHSLLVCLVMIAGNQTTS